MINVVILVVSHKVCAENGPPMYDRISADVVISIPPSPIGLCVNSGTARLRLNTTMLWRSSNPSEIDPCTLPLACHSSKFSKAEDRYCILFQNVRSQCCNYGNGAFLLGGLIRTVVQTHWTITPRNFVPSFAAIHSALTRCGVSMVNRAEEVSVGRMTASELATGLPGGITKDCCAIYGA